MFWVQILLPISLTILGISLLHINNKENLFVKEDFRRVRSLIIDLSERQTDKSEVKKRLEEIGKLYLFEPNDQITRNEITNAINGLMIDLVAKRGIYDYLVVCDESNNTPARIDRNELWVDIAIEPVKAVEFIYIPVRIKNTGEIAAGQVASSATP